MEGLEYPVAPPLDRPGELQGHPQEEKSGLAGTLKRGRCRPNLLSMPANVATANLKPPMWSGLGAGRLMRDLGGGSKPGGFLRCGERDREKKGERKEGARERERESEREK